MLLFDIGAILCIVGLFNFPYISLSSRFKKMDENALLAGQAIMYLLIIAGAVMMMISHYVVEGNQSII